MPHSATEAATYETAITLPDDGDARTSTSVNTPLGQLANRTKYLHDVTDVNGSKKIRHVSTLAALKALTGNADGDIVFLVDKATGAGSHIEAFGGYMFLAAATDSDTSCVGEATWPLSVTPDAGGGRWRSMFGGLFGPLSSTTADQRLMLPVPNRTLLVPTHTGGVYGPTAGTGGWQDTAIKKTNMSLKTGDIVIASCPLSAVGEAATTFMSFRLRMYGATTDIMSNGEEQHSQTIRDSKECFHVQHVFTATATETVTVELQVSTTSTKTATVTGAGLNIQIIRPLQRVGGARRPLPHLEVRAVVVGVIAVWDARNREGGVYHRSRRRLRVLVPGVPGDPVHDHVGAVHEREPTAVDGHGERHGPCLRACVGRASDDDAAKRSDGNPVGRPRHKPGACLAGIAQRPAREGDVLARRVVELDVLVISSARARGSDFVDDNVQRRPGPARARRPSAALPTRSTRAAAPRHGPAGARRCPARARRRATSATASPGAAHAPRGAPGRARRGTRPRDSRRASAPPGRAAGPARTGAHARAVARAVLEARLRPLRAARARARDLRPRRADERRRARLPRRSATCRTARASVAGPEAGEAARAPAGPAAVTAAAASHRDRSAQERCSPSRRRPHPPNPTGSSPKVTPWASPPS